MKYINSDFKYNTNNSKNKHLKFKLKWGHTDPKYAEFPSPPQKSLQNCRNFNLNTYTNISLILISMTYNKRTLSRD